MAALGVASKYRRGLDFSGSRRPGGVQDTLDKAAAAAVKDAMEQPPPPPPGASEPEIGIYRFLVESQPRNGDSRWSDALVGNAWAEPRLTAFLDGHGATSVHREFVETVRRHAKATLPNRWTGYYSSRKIRKLLAQRFAAAYCERGVHVTVGKATVESTSRMGPEGAEALSRDFVWVELRSEAAT